MSTYYERHNRYPDLPRYKELERPPPRRDGEEAEARAERQLAILGELADMAIDLARSAYRRAKAREAILDAALEDAAPEAAGEDAGAPGGSPRAAATVAAAAAGVDVGVDVGAGGASVDDRIDALKGQLLGAASGRVGPGGIPYEGDPSLVFARLSTVIFRALDMDRRVAEAAAAAWIDPEDETRHPNYDPEMTPERKRKIEARWKLLCTRKNTVVRVLKQAIQTERPHEDAEACALALSDKLLEFERFEMLNKTIWDNVMRHARKLGLSPVWEDWANEPWAIAEIDGELEWNIYPGPEPWPEGDEDEPEPDP